MADFPVTFRQLFGGGTAGLRLVDEQDLLESGIDIIAQPPGKKLQNVLLLSGAVVLDTFCCNVPLPVVGRLMAGMDLCLPTRCSPTIRCHHRPDNVVPCF